MALLALGTAMSVRTFLPGLGLDRISQERNLDANLGRSGIDPTSSVATGPQALAHVARNLPATFIGPFPWQLHSDMQLLALPDVLVLWVLLPSLWRGLRRAGRLVGRAMLLLLIPAFATQLMLTVVVGDFGTMLRERPQVLILLVPFVALGLKREASDSPGATIRGSG